MVPTAERSSMEEKPSSHQTEMAKGRGAGVTADEVTAFRTLMAKAAPAIAALDLMQGERWSRAAEIVRDTVGGFGVELDAAEQAGGAEDYARRNLAELSTVVELTARTAKLALTELEDEARAIV